MKGINRGRNSKPRAPSVHLNDLPAVFTDSSVPLAAGRRARNRRRIRFPTESVGNSDSVHTPGQPTLDGPLLLDSREVERLLGIGRTKVYELMAREQIPVVRIGRSVRVPRDELRAWIASKVTAHDFHPVEGSGS